MKKQNFLSAMVLTVVLVLGTGLFVFASDVNSLDNSESYDLSCSDQGEATEVDYSVQGTDMLGEQFSLSQYNGTLYTVPAGTFIEIFANEEGVRKAVNEYTLSGDLLVPLHWDDWFGGPYGLDLISPPDYNQPEEIEFGQSVQYYPSQDDIYLLVEIYKGEETAPTQYLIYVQGNNTVEEVVETTPVTAVKNTSAVWVNGVEKSFESYNIDGNNYFKLRDLAYVLSGTRVGFDIQWDAAKNRITLTYAPEYTPVGGEMTSSSTVKNTVSAVPTSSLLQINSNTPDIVGYNINGNNFYKLRDIGLYFNFGVIWDEETSSIHINTEEGYSD